MKEAQPILNNLKVPKGYSTNKIKDVVKEIIAQKGASTTIQIKSNQPYKRPVNHQNEFDLASMMSKTLRQSFSRGMSEICEAYVSGKLTAQFRNLAKMEEGKNGTRSLFLSKHGHLLNGFEFNSQAPYKEIFGAKYYLKPGSKRGHVILHFPAFVPEKTFKYPNGATNFKITARFIALSDYQFDHTEQSYLPANKDLHGKFGTYESNMLPLLKIPTEPMTGLISVENRIIPEGTGLFLVMAISFYRYEKGKFEHLFRDSSMQIQKVL